MTYCKPQSIQQWNCPICSEIQGVQEVNVVQSRKFQSLGYVAYNEIKDLLVVAVRGSDNVRNWMSNLNTVKTKYEYCKKCTVHQGFLNFWHSISEGILSNLKNLKSQHPNAKLLVIGHSLGGAGANLAALDIYNKLNLKADYFMTLGQPRVGNLYFSNYLNNVFPNFIRITNSKDPVPRVPLTMFGFRHSFTEIFYYNKFTKFDDDKYKICSGTNGEDKQGNGSKLGGSFIYHLQYFGGFTGCSSEENIDLLEETYQI